MTRAIKVGGAAVSCKRANPEFPVRGQKRTSIVDGHDVRFVTGSALSLSWTRRVLHFRKTALSDGTTAGQLQPNHRYHTATVYMLCITRDYLI